LCRRLFRGDASRKATRRGADVTTQPRVVGRTCRREMDDLGARLCDLPEELKVLVLCHIEHVKTHHILALSLDVWEAISLLRALQRTVDFEGVAGDDIADHLVRLLDDDRVRCLEKVRALELIGVYKDRLCEYACGRNFEVLKWAHHELDLPWAPYPAGRVSDDVLVLRVIREIWSELKQDEWWPENVGPEEWDGVKMVDGRVVELELSTENEELNLTGAVPAEIGQLTSLRLLDLRGNGLLTPGGNELTSVPPEIGQLTSLKELYLKDNKLTIVPPEIGQLTSLEVLNLDGNQLTSVPAEIGQLTSLMGLHLGYNELMSVPAEIWQLTSLEKLDLHLNFLTIVPAEIGQLTSLTELRLASNKLTSVPAAIGQLTSLVALNLSSNELTSVPAEIGQLAALEKLNLAGNQLTSVPAAIRELKAAGCNVNLFCAMAEETEDY